MEARPEGRWVIGYAPRAEAAAKEAQQRDAQMPTQRSILSGGLPTIQSMVAIKAHKRFAAAATQKNALITPPPPSDPPSSASWPCLRLCVG